MNARALQWLALVAAGAVTAVGVGFLGPWGDEWCRDDRSHAGFAARDHWADDRTWPPTWACHYDREIWLYTRYENLVIALLAGTVLVVLIATLRRQMPRWLQGVVVAWLTASAVGAGWSFDLLGAAFVGGLGLACAAFYQRDLRRRLGADRAFGVLMALMIGGITYVVLCISILLGDSPLVVALAVVTGGVLGAASAHGAGVPDAHPS